MRLKIPYPIQFWFNSISAASRKLQHSLDEASEKQESTVVNSTPDVVFANPAVLGAIQQLYYEIFAMPVYTTEAIGVAQTICGHVYDFAQHKQHPDLQLLVLDLIPTLIHVYLVITSTLSSDGVTCDRVGVRGHSHHHPPTPPFSAANIMNAGVRKSIRDRMTSGLKRVPGSPSTATTTAAAINNSSVGKNTHKNRHGHSLIPSNSSNSMPPLAAATATPGSAGAPTISADRLGTNNIAVLTAILEALLVGLYNIYMVGRSLPSATATGSALPPFGAAGGPGETIYSGRLTAVNEGKHARLLSAENNNSPPHEARSRSKMVVTAVEGLTACNQWHVLHALLRLSTDRCHDLSERGRSALCCLALLLGPSGLQTHRLPECLLCGDCGHSCTVENAKTRVAGWRNRFARNVVRRKGRGGSGNGKAQRHRQGSNHLDITSIAGPLKSASTALQLKSKGSRVVTTITTNWRPETAAPLNKTLQSVDATQDAMETLTLDNNLYDEEDDVEDVNDLDDGDEDDIGDLDGSSATTDELDSNASLCSEDFGVEGESKNAENQKSRNLPHINDVGSNTSNAIKELITIDGQEEQDEAFENANSRQEEPDEEPVTANSQEPSIVSVPDPPIVPPPPLPSAMNLPPPSRPVAATTTITTTTKRKPRWKVKTIKTTTLTTGGATSGGGSKRAPLYISRRIPRLSPCFVIDLLPSLHFLLSTSHAALAATAISSLASRANMELWSCVLIYVNSICNSKVFLDATSTVDATGSTAAVPDQTNQSNAQIASPSMASSPIISRHTRHVNVPRSSSEDDRSTVVGSTHRLPIKTAITNASFQAVRLSEDIPIINVDGGAETDDAGPITIVPRQRIRAKSQSPQSSRRGDEITLPLLASSPRNHADLRPQNPEMEPVVNMNDVNLGQDMGGSARRTWSFNLRLCGSRSRKPKHPPPLGTTQRDLAALQRVHSRRDDRLVQRIQTIIPNRNYNQRQRYLSQ